MRLSQVLLPRDVEEDRLVLPNNEDGLAVIKALIGRGLIYVVINSNFEATLNGEVKSPGIRLLQVSLMAMARSAAR